jgi:RNA polymerase sigma-70 factor (ECF subfamily)
MESPDDMQITALLNTLDERNRPEVAARLMPLVYEELRRLARKYFRHERPNHTLQPTALVHEAYLRMVDQTRVEWQGRTQFFAVAAVVMRRILVDYARARRRARRGGGRCRIELDSRVTPADMSEYEVLAIHEAIERLSALDDREAKVVELRFFGGLGMNEVADAIGVSKRTVESDWKHAKAWLRTQFTGETKQ